jgi:hypothetical protein
VSGTEPTPSPPSGGGRRQWLPRGALVFFGLAAVLVLIFALVRPGWFEDDPGDDGGDAPAYGFAKTLASTGATDGLQLSDDNATSQSFTVPVPLDSELSNPLLTLVGTTQVAESSTIFLRVLADGTSVFVQELPVGDDDLDEEIPLPTSAVEDGSVRIQVRLTGSLDQQRCNLTQELGAFVQIDPDQTLVHGTLDEELHTVRDVVAGFDHEVTLGLALPADSRPWFETAARVGVALTQTGHDVTYADLTDDAGAETDRSTVLVGPADALEDAGWSTPDDADADASVVVGTVDGKGVLGVVAPAAHAASVFLTTSAVTTADGRSSAPQSADPEQLSGSAVTLESLGVDTSVQQITTRRSWTASYSLADLPDGTVPTQLRLSMIVPVTTDDARWLVQVQLNGALVDSIRLAGSGRQDAQVQIPAGAEALRNQLVVTLIRDRDVGGCNVRQTTYDVQLLPDTQLVLGGEGAGFTALPAMFDDGFEVGLAATATDDAAASLAGFVPTLAEFSGWEQEPGFVWDGATPGGPFFVVGDPPDGVEAPVTISDGRVSADGFDLQAAEDGLVIQCADAGATPGVVVTPAGDPGTVVPAYGREVARVVAGDGGGFVVSPSGRVVTAPPVRSGG